MNPRLALLHPYPFERLRTLLKGLDSAPGKTPINLGIGEPQHPTPQIIRDALVASFDLLSKYPPALGMPSLREAIADWHAKRYPGVVLDPNREILPVAGTREALFALAQAVLDSSERPVVLLPNPFYQIYEGAAIMAGAEPVYVSTPAHLNYQPDWDSVPTDVWPRVRLAYVCSPGNPAGAVLDLSGWKTVFDLADRYGFIVAADECYSEIYNGETPLGALAAALALRRSHERLLTFNSLSKRSSAAGLRSGFVAGDHVILERFLLYRTYHGAAPSLLTQAASVAAWKDEDHVLENRAKYQAKFKLAEEIIPGFSAPAGGFFLWLPVADDEAMTRELYAEEGLTVLPGSYLGREVSGFNPGASHIRVALVPELELCQDALNRLARHL